MAPKSPEAIARRKAYKREYDKRRRIEGKLSPKKSRGNRPSRAGQVLTEEQLVKRREAGRRYYAKNRERRSAEAAQWNKDHPEKAREHRKRALERIKETDPEKLRAQRRASLGRQSAQPGFKEKRTAQARRRMERDPEARERAVAATKRFTHGTDYQILFAQLWAEQDGRCYLCGEPLAPGRTTHIDHDHACCPKGKTCSYCRRGLACERCNHVLGHASDSVELLRRIADNFEPVNARIKAQLASRDVQGTLFDDAA